MSKQLAISAAFAVFAMSAFVLFGTQPVPQDGGQQNGATSELAAPSFTAKLPLFD